VGMQFVRKLPDPLMDVFFVDQNLHALTLKLDCLESCTLGFQSLPRVNWFNG
jgi:hypothetical protein